MDYTERLKNVSVLGAAGKMGSGILLLTAMEMTDLAMQPENKGENFILYALDISDDALAGVMNFLRAQVLKAAEKKTVALRKVYAERSDLIENRDIINQYVFDVLSIVRPTTNLESTYQSSIIFEAIKEDAALKVKIFSTINTNSKKSPWFFSNTSSIPLNELDKKAGLEGRLIGYHFYNPPAVQKLVELISAKSTINELVEFSRQYAKKLRKKIVPSNDFAGFIGNGHFMRDALYGIQEAHRISEEFSFTEAVYMINKVSQEYLIRPMGIFQLIDYVGVDVCQAIMGIMNPYLKNEDLHSSLLDKLLSLGVKGGQYSNGSQKDGFLKYEKGRPGGIYDPEKQSYTPIEDLKEKCDQKLGAMPGSFLPWKAVIGNPDKKDILNKFFEELNTMDTLGANLARSYGKRSKEIGKQLVADGVAGNEEDVNTVLLTGFYHSFGPINNYFD